MNRNELTIIDEMTLDEKVIMLFKLFPKNQSYSEDVIESLPIINKYGIQVIASYQHTYYIDVYVKGLGSFKKHWGVDSLTDGYIYRFSFAEGDHTEIQETSGGFGKEASDKICDRALPFMLSGGEHRRGIPLLLHDFPEFAKFALKCPVIED